jgi:hypothetical protein
VTDAEKLIVPPVVAEAEAGATDTVTFGAAVTVTVARPLFEASATLVATTWKVPGLPGAVYRPEPSTFPPDAPSWTDQVTPVDWLESVPVTAAEKLVCSPATIDAVDGETDTATVGAAVTSTVATAVFEESATLVATTCAVAGFAGAV